ncbi:MAG: hypothetical protein ABFS42_13255 [Candidatus Krumholzibacteriota bacterium]
MGVIEAVMGPRSKRDLRLPYTYEAWVDILNGQGREPVYDHYFSSTICGLVTYLDSMGLSAGDVLLFGVYRGRQTRLSTELLTTEDGCWLKRPEICHVLEKYYEKTRDECYRGHVEEGPCSFDDRNREGSGPSW